MFTSAQRSGNGKDRAGRKFEILTYLYEARYFMSAVKLDQNGNARSWRTSYEIARALHMKPSKHLRGILEELYQEECVWIDAMVHRKNVRKFTYAIDPNVRWSSEWRAAFDQWLTTADEERQFPF
jgi:hypothetical protein